MIRRSILKNNKHHIDFTGIDMSEKDKEKLIKLFESLDNPKENELNFLKLSITKDAKNNLVLKVLLRNGTENDLDIKQISIRILTETDQTVSQGSFQLGNLVVCAHSSKPAKFVFPKKSVLIHIGDLSLCTIHVISNLRS